MRNRSHRTIENEDRGIVRDLPSAWPAGRMLAVSVNVMLEQWAEPAAPGLGPMGNPLRAGVIDTQAQSWAAYGPQAGAYRILDVLAELDVSAVFYVSGLLAERHPQLVREIAKAKHALGAHGWSQDVVPAYQNQEAEHTDLVRSLRAMELASGTRPVGYLSPRCTPSKATAALLVKEHFNWHADYFDRDLPRTMRHPEGSIVAMPFTMEINDLPHAVRYGNDPASFVSMLEGALNAARRSKRPACIDITVHAHVYGRATSVWAFREALRLTKEYDDVAWLTNHANLALAFT